MIIKKLINNFSLGFVIFYFVAAIAIRYLSPGGDEIFPFFAWNLFDYVPNSSVEYIIEISNYDGYQLKKPTDFSDATFAGQLAKSIAARDLIQKYAQSYISHSTDFEKYRRVLELVYLGKTKEYRLVKESYNPIEKHFTNNSNRLIIAKFTTLHD